jgi:hypothetical protein
MTRKNMFKNNYLTPILGVILLLCPLAQAERFSFAALGDTPYHLPGDFDKFERLIKHVNAAKPAFTIHVGDIKPGNRPCSDEHFDRIHGMFATFEQPLIYTPGDNEWTDCHRADNGGMDPIERLAKLRSQFYADPTRSLGKMRIPLAHQATYIENARWERAGVVFATLHVVGSNNNLQRDQTAVNEYIARNAANLAWMRTTFEHAAKNNARAVVLAFQADLGWEHDGFDDRRSGFNDTLSVLRRHAREFGKPVLVVHGDRHRFVIDKPLRLNRQLLTNVTRLMVFGDQEVHGVLITVDTDNPDVFSFTTLMVPENLPASKP